MRLARESLGATPMIGGLRPVTGFNFNALAEVPLTPPPSPAELVPRLGPVCNRMPETHPEFCARLSGRVGLAQTAAE
jgi:glutaconate CoA-transferase subunit B